MTSIIVPTLENIETWKKHGDVRKLIRLLAMPRSPYHLHALHAIEDIGDAAIAPLIQVLRIEEKNVDLLCFSVDLLSLLKANDAVQPIIDLVGRPAEWYAGLPRSEKLWGASIDALGAISTGEAVSFLNRCAADRKTDAKRRIRAIESLTISNNPEVPDIFSRIWENAADETVKAAVISGLISIEEAGLEKILSIYKKQTDREAKISILTAIGDHQAKAYLTHLIGWLDEEDREILKRIIWAIGEIGETRAFAPIKSRISSLPQEARLVAGEVLVKFGWHPTEEKDGDSRLLHSVVSSRFHESVKFGKPGVELVGRYLDQNPDKLVKYTLTTVSDEMWWSVMNALAAHDREKATAYFKVLFDWNDFPSSIIGRIRNLKERVAKW